MELNASLIGPLAGWCALSVSSVHAIDNVHALNDFSNRAKALIVQERISLFPCIDKDLCGTTIGTGRGKDHGSAGIGNLDGVVLEVLASPTALNRRVAIDSKLDNKAGNHTKDSAFVPKSNFGKFLRVVGNGGGGKRVFVRVRDALRLPTEESGKKTGFIRTYLESFDTTGRPGRLHLNLDGASVAGFAI